MSLTINTSDHKLDSTQVKFVPSPNHSGKFTAGKADTIVIHFTAGSGFESSVNHLASRQAKASAHVVIGRDGQICQLVPFNVIAWHAGKSQWKGRSGLNHYSLGIELDNAGELNRNPAGQYVSWFKKSYAAEDVFEVENSGRTESRFWHSYTQKQIETTFALCHLLCETYGITEIVGHEEISPGRKIDPGPAFPLERLRLSVQADRAEDGMQEPPSVLNNKIVAANKLNVRDGPGSDFKVITTPLSAGKKVKIITSRDGWSKIEFTATGWVSSRYLK